MVLQLLFWGIWLLLLLWILDYVISLVQLSHCCLSFELRFLIIPLLYFVIVLFVIRYTASDYYLSIV